jgi:hypothetical protein
VPAWAAAPALMAVATGSPSTEAEASAFFSRSRSSRATSHCRSGSVLATSRITMASLETDSTPQTSGSSMITSCQRGSCHIWSAVSFMVWRTSGSSWS